jgi:hypothetical protein
MAKRKNFWKRGRGTLGILTPLIGSWKAAARSPMGPVTCTRTFTPILGGKFIQLAVRWEFGKGGYEELAVFGVDGAAEVSFWSFTSDGKSSNGATADATDIHPEAVGFEAQMPAGLARMAYWPDEADGCYWAVEAKGKRGWKRFAEHHYKRA